MLLALLAGPLLAEGILRWLLFSDSDLARRLGAKYRDPSLFAYGTDAPEFSGLSYLFVPPGDHWSPVQPHPDLGWVGSAIDPETLGHAEPDRVGARTPVLFYGSSFARCSVLDDCFEDLLETSEAGRRFGLLNYAVPAYGLDQMLVLLRRTVGSHAADGPVVVLAFVLESDLGRCLTSFFCAPKPRFERRGRGYELVQPDELDPGLFLERHPPVSSYLARYLVHGAGLLPAGRERALAGEDARVEERRRLWKYLLGGTCADLHRRGIRFFVLLFHPEGTFRREWIHADADLLLAFLDQTRIPYVDSKTDVERAVQQGARLEDLFQPEGPAKGHPTALGTQILFGALLRGLEGHYDDARPFER